MLKNVSHLLRSFPDHGESLFNYLPGFLFFVKDKNRHFLSANQELINRLGKTGLEEILGKTDHDLLPSYLAEPYVKDDEFVLSGHMIKDRVELVTGGRGLVDWAITIKIPIRDDEGAICGLAGVTRPFESGPNGEELPSDLRKALETIKSNFHKKIKIEKLAKSVGLSLSSFERKFKKKLQMTPVQYVRHVRVHEACRMLIKGTKAASQIAMDCGFSDQSHFNREFLRIMQMTPTQYRKGQILKTQ